MFFFFSNCRRSIAIFYLTVEARFRSLYSDNSKYLYVRCNSSRLKTDDLFAVVRVRSSLLPRFMTVGCTFPVCGTTAKRSPIRPQPKGQNFPTGHFLSRWSSVFQECSNSPCLSLNTARPQINPIFRFSGSRSTAVRNSAGRFVQFAHRRAIEKYPARIKIHAITDREVATISVLPSLQEKKKEKKTKQLKQAFCRDAKLILTHNLRRRGDDTRSA